MKELYELKEKLCDELKDYSKKNISGSAIDVVDKLSHTIKNLDKIIETYEEEGYSGRYSNRMYDNNMSMASDRYSNARRRDSRGRYSRNYSRDGYSYGTAEELRDIMDEAPEDVKSDIQRIIRKMESM